ncbi:hypothetical protein CM49_05744 [Paenibacillus sp. P1XP2]|nr:hypothetical protein CM49_05744 [Paenibacillus sp. P1XP2]
MGCGEIMEERNLKVLTAKPLMRRQALTIYEDDNLRIRPVTERDLPRLWELSAKEEAPEWKKWDAPYYEHTAMSFEKYAANKDNLVHRDDFWAIEVNGELIGTVSYYWEHKPSYWLEMGIVIYHRLLERGLRHKGACVVDQQIVRLPAAGPRWLHHLVGQPPDDPGRRKTRVYDGSQAAEMQALQRRFLRFDPDGHAPRGMGRTAGKIQRIGRCRTILSSFFTAAALLETQTCGSRSPLRPAWNKSRLSLRW